MRASIITRCPWCTARMPEGAPRCAQCGCVRVDASDYGVARVLRAAGVDRIALPERARTLDPATRSQLEGDWDAQRDMIRALRADLVRALEGLPARERLLDDADDELELLIPVAPAHAAALRFDARPTPDTAPGRAAHKALLEAMRASHPASHARAIATIALVRAGVLSRELLRELGSLVSDPGAIGALAAVTLASFRVRGAGLTPRLHDDTTGAALTRALTIDALKLHAAVALTLFDPRTRAQHEPLLRAAAASADVELRMDAALALADDALLAAFLHDDDEERRGEARDALARLGSARLVPLLAPPEDAPLPPDKERSALLSRLPHPLPSGVRDAVIACAERGSAELSAHALRVLVRGRFAERDADDRRALVGLFERAARTLGARATLDVLAWVADGDGRESADEERDGEALAPFVRAAARALAGTPLTQELLWGRGFALFLAHADDDALGALDNHLADRDAAALVWGAVLDAHARRHPRAKPSALTRLLTRLWVRAPRPADAVAEALARRGGMSGRDDVVAFFWERFATHPDERADIVRALRPWRAMLHEKRRATAASEQPGGGDVLTVWRTWSSADPDDMWRLIDELRESVSDDALAALTSAVFDSAERVVATHPRTAIVTVFRMAAEVASRVRHPRDDDAQTEPQSETQTETQRAAATQKTDAAAAVLAERLPGFRVRYASASAQTDAERNSEHFLDDIATEERLIAEAFARREERAARERERREREQERERREQERLAQEQERLAQQQREQQRLEQLRIEQARIEQERVLALRLSIVGHASSGADVSAPRLPQPAFSREGIDDEPYLPGPGPRTLLEYAQLLKAMQSGHDVMQLLAAWQLDVDAWSACATRWGEVMVRDPAAALRFAQLLSNRWT